MKQQQAVQVPNVIDDHAIAAAATATQQQPSHATRAAPPHQPHHTPSTANNDTTNSTAAAANNNNAAVAPAATASLALSYRNILKIDNLVGFDALTTLQLDNNIIGKIENIGHLVNLTLLDLSFNNITEIGNLGSLTNLTSLSLYSNQLTAVANLEALGKLQVLSLGNNLLADYASVMYLRPFKQLQVLTLAGNPLAQEADYRPFVLAHLKHIRFLDYRLIDEQAVQAAMEQFQDGLQRLQEAEAVEAAAADAAEAAARRTAVLCEAGVAQVEALRELLLAPGEGELGELWGHPALSERLAAFRETVATAIGAFVDEALEAHRVKRDEQGLFEQALGAQRSASAEASKAEVAHYADAVKKALLECDGALPLVELQSLRQANLVLYEALMDLEVSGSERNAQSISLFEAAYDELSKRSLERIAAFFTRTRELEAQFAEQLHAAVAELLDDAARHPERVDDVAEELKLLLLDKEAVNNGLAAAHEARVSRVDALEDEMRSLEMSRAAALVSAAADAEHARNRMRVNEAWNLVHVIHKEELDASADACGR